MARPLFRGRAGAEEVPRSAERSAELLSVTDEERRGQDQNEWRRDRQARHDGDTVQCVDRAFAPKHGSNSCGLGETPRSRYSNIGLLAPSQIGWLIREIHPIRAGGRGSPTNIKALWYCGRGGLKCGDGRRLRVAGRPGPLRTCPGLGCRGFCLFCGSGRLDRVGSARGLRSRAWC